MLKFSFCLTKANIVGIPVQEEGEGWLLNGHSFGIGIMFYQVYYLTDHFLFNKASAERIWRIEEVMMPNFDPIFGVEAYTIFNNCEGTVFPRKSFEATKALLVNMEYIREGYICKI